MTRHAQQLLFLVFTLFVVRINADCQLVGGSAMSLGSCAAIIAPRGAGTYCAYIGSAASELLTADLSDIGGSVITAPRAEIELRVVQNVFSNPSVGGSVECADALSNLLCATAYAPCDESGVPLPVCRPVCTAASDACAGVDIQTIASELPTLEHISSAIISLYTDCVSNTYTVGCLTSFPVAPSDTCPLALGEVECVNSTQLAVPLTVCHTDKPFCAAFQSVDVGETSLDLSSVGGSSYPLLADREVWPLLLSLVMGQAQFGGSGACAAAVHEFLCAFEFPVCKQSRPWRPCSCDSVLSACETFDINSAVAYYQTSGANVTLDGVPISFFLLLDQVYSQLGQATPCSSSRPTVILPCFPVFPLPPSQLEPEICTLGCNGLINGDAIDECGVCGGNGHCGPSFESSVYAELTSLRDSLAIESLMNVPGLNVGGVVILYFVFAAMLLMMGYVLLVLRKCAEKFHGVVFVTFVATAVSLVAYFCMATDHGVVVFRNVNGTGWHWNSALLSHEPAVGRNIFFDPEYATSPVYPFFYARYVAWSIVQPLLVWELGLVAGVDSLTTAFVMVCVTLMQLSCFVGGFVLSGAKWIMWILGLCCFAPVPVTFYRTFAPLARARGDDNARVYNRLSLLLLVTWALYLALWIFSDGTHTMQPADVVNFIFGSLDVVSQIGFGVYLLRNRELLRL